MAIGPGCTTAPQPATEAAAPVLPEDVLVPLHAMGDLLRSAKTMKFTSLGLMDEALANGQLLQIGRRSTYTVRRPDGLCVGIDGDDAKWQLWYDGKQLTVLDRVTDDFAVSTAPPTLDELFDNAFREHGLSIPMSDLMYSDADGGLLKNVQAARHLGIDYLGDYACHHLGFRQETIDWQLWIDAGDQAVPRKLVIAYKHEPGTPQYVATLEDWELDDGVEVVTIDGVEYYLIEGAYYQQTEDGFVVVDPYADELDDAAAAGLNLEDSEALRVLQAMSEFMGSLDSFKVDLVETHDDALETGERFQLSNERRLFITRPDKARAQTLGEGSNRQFWYDGKQVTVYSGVLKTYSTVDAPNTLTEMMAAMSATYGLSFPLADLLFLDIYYAMTEGLMTAEYVGGHEAGGVACDHLAFSQDTIDWEIWVERGEKPVPRKIRISYKLEPGIPVYTSEIMALEKTDEPAGAYTFQPPKDAIEIEMEPL